MNIELLTLSKLTAIQGDEGNFTVTIKKSPRYVDLDKCIACGACAEKCPAKAADEFNKGISKRKAIYVPYAQAVPLKYAIDPDRCIFLKKGKCGACQKICPTGAVNFDDQEQEISLHVGSIIVTAGLKTFDPSAYDNYQHARLPNVVTSMEFERILSAGGPTGGHVLRPSDGKLPGKIAWLQCVGSRDLNKCDNEYCSSVCCMYAIKEAVIAQEHLGADFQATIFYMDMRTHGKDFERYYDRAKADGVRFICSKVHTVTQADESGTLTLEYVTDDGRRQSEDFDIVVLSVGMEPAESAVEVAGNLGIELNGYNFVKTNDVQPVATSRPGIYVAGVAQGCKDIPQSVMEASAAACSAGLALSPARGTLVKEKQFPAETDVSGEPPRIGVFVCNCGINIGADRPLQYGGPRVCSQGHHVECRHRRVCTHRAHRSALCQRARKGVDELLPDAQGRNAGGDSRHGILSHYAGGGFHQRRERPRFRWPYVRSLAGQETVSSVDDGPGVPIFQPRSQHERCRY